MMDDERDQQHLYEDKSYITQKVNKDVMGISEYYKVECIEEDRQQDQQYPEQKALSQTYLSHKYSYGIADEPGFCIESKIDDRI